MPLTRPSRSALLFLATYAAAWSLLPPLLVASLPLDVVESLSWGHEWQWGYYKHPPLAPWVLYAFYRAFGRAGPFLLSQLCIVATLWLVWRTGCRLMTRERALLGTALTMGVAFYTQPALEFNHNIAQMPLWAALGWALLAALQDGRMRQWLLLGLLAAAGLLTKYSIVILLACLVGYLLFTPARRVLRQPGPWLALALALALLAPHLYWLWRSDWLPIAYARSRGLEAGAARWGGLPFLAAQAAAHLPLAAVVAASAWRARRQLPSGRDDWRLHASWPGYLWLLALAPGLLTVLGALLAGAALRDMWGAPMWCFSGLLVAALLPQAWLAPLQPRLWRALALWLVLISLVSWADLALGARWRQRPARTDWPAAALAAHASASWAAVSRCPLDVIAGTTGWRAWRPWRRPCSPRSWSAPTRASARG